MTDIHPPGRVGSAIIDHFTIRPGDKKAEREAIPLGTYARLFVDGEQTMSDTPMEWRTNISFITASFGDVLIGGLGLGMILLEVQKRSNVKSITVVEKNQDVMDLVLPRLPLNEKVRIVHDDIFAYTPNRLFDIIFIDIWSHINPVIYYQEMLPLKQRYTPFLKAVPEDDRRTILCWAEYEAKHAVELR